MSQDAIESACDHIREAIEDLESRICRKDQKLTELRDALESLEEKLREHVDASASMFVSGRDVNPWELMLTHCLVCNELCCGTREELDDEGWREVTTDQLCGVLCPDHSGREWRAGELAAASKHRRPS